MFDTPNASYTAVIVGATPLAVVGSPRLSANCDSVERERERVGCALFIFIHIHHTRFTMFVVGIVTDGCKVISGIDSVRYTTYCCVVRNYPTEQR